MLRAQPGPTSLVALVAATGLHGNTVREHLDGLIDLGLAQRHRAPAVGRGRPAWLYEATTRDAPSGRPEYVGLATALASHIHRESSAPRQDALAAGAEWGRGIARAGGPPARRTAAAARRTLVDLLDDMGFGPQASTDNTVVRLTRCPLLEVAHRYPDVVCGVHLGIVRGAMAEYGADGTGSELEPFAEPGACILRLKGGRRGSRE